MLIIQLECADNPTSIMQNAEKVQSSLNGNEFHICKVKVTKSHPVPSETEQSFKYHFDLHDLKSAFSWLYLKI